MDMKKSNLRDIVIGPDKAKDVRDTQMLDGLATSSTPAEKAHNETVQYETSKGVKGNTWGGMNTGS